MKDDREESKMTYLNVCMALLLLLSLTPAHAALELDGLIPEEGKGDEGKNPPAQINVPAPQNDQAAQPTKRTGFDDLLEFSNDDKLHGRLATVLPGEDGHMLSWHHPSVSKPIDFGLKSLKTIQFHVNENRKVPDQSASVKLTNGDLLTGNIVSLGEDYLVMDTWYAGRMNIERVMMTSLRPNAEGSTVVFEGPSDLANWNLGDHGVKNTWRIKNGALYPLQSYPIGKEIEAMPDRASIEFEADWRGYPAFNFVFYTDNVSKITGNYYMLQISSSSIYMRRYTRNQGSMNMWNMNYNDFSNNQTSHAKFTLLTDKEQKKFTLLIDGNMIKQWSDAGTFAGMGNGIMFAPQNTGGMKFYNIRVSEWDGAIPQAGEAEEADAEADQVQFSNKDKVTGSLVSIADGMASFKSEFATLDIPLERINEIVLSTENAERARRNKDDMRLKFTRTGSITMQLLKLENNILHGKSENFGEVTIPLDAFRDAEFNIYDQKEGEGSGEDGDEDFSF
ncbi:MAG: hypothetical protein ACI9TH_004316 [Kiritimatiellia bacterium]|jgi:hypothetical protein